MYSLSKVTLDHIKNLKDIELSQLLHLLLQLEAGKNKLQGLDLSVPFNITTGDAGSDGKIHWTGDPAKTLNIPNRFTIFQNKATDLIPSKCSEEILEPNKKGQSRKLKTQIKKLVEENGCYVLFTTQALVDKGKDERISKFREAIKLAGHKNWETFEIAVYDANKIKDWVNEYIESVLKVQSFNGITRPFGFMTWTELGKEIDAASTPFQVNSLMNKKIAAIRSAIDQEKVVRVSGHSGLGKTRLIYEALNITASQPAVTTGLVYYDLGLASNPDEISKYIISHRNYQHGTIIIDNCDAETHLILSRLIKAQGNLKIITIGFNDKPEIEDLKIRLDKNDQRELVSAIVEQKLGRTHTTSDKEYIKSVSEGYPWMAVKFCTGVTKSGMSNLTQYTLDEFIKKLLFNAPEGHEEYAVIRACSVFSAFGFLDDGLHGLISPDLAATLQAQMDFIRTEIYDGSLSESRFREICHKFRLEDIIEKRGTFYIVKPTVLAIHLASQWLLINSHDRIKKVIESLKNIELEEKFVDRLTDLDQYDKAKYIVNELWGVNGFFGSAEVLSTKWGSLLFRYVVEVSPEATVKSLNNVYANKSIEDIQKMTTARRNQVWALEKLVFRKQSFEPAAKLLYRFAVAENETWANNATHQFVHLFQVYLAGTEVNYQERLDIIKWGLQQNENEFVRIAVQALSRGLRYGNFTRAGGAEKQGSSVPLKDYEPSTWQEIFDYWIEILALLTPIAKIGSEHDGIARQAIVSAIRPLVRHGQFELVDRSIRAIFEAGWTFWPEALNELKKTIRFEKNLPEPIKEKITQLIETLTPQDLKNKLYLTVSKPEWSFDQPNSLSAEKKISNAHELAESIIKRGLPMEDVWPELLRGEQRMGVAFGKRLGQLSLVPAQLSDQMLTTLADIPVNEQNPDVLIGFVVGAANPVLLQSVFQSMMNNVKIAQHAFYLARIAKMPMNDIIRLFEVLDRFNLSVTYFSALQYGGSLEDFSVEQIIQLATKLKEYDMAGHWVSLSIIYAYCYQNEEKFQQCNEFLMKLLGEVNMTITEEGDHTMESFQWSEIVLRLLSAEKEVEFAKTMMRQMVELFSDQNFHHQSDYFNPEILRLLLDNYFDDTWDILGKALIDENYIFVLNIRNAIGAKNGWMGGNGMLFDNQNRNQRIFEWCKLHPEIAPQRVANMMPIMTTTGNNTAWHPFSKQIIDQFGDQESVLSELRANMGTYGWVGSSVEYLQQLKSLVATLLNHHLPLVKKWAENYHARLEQEIKIEQIHDEEDSLR